MSTKQKKVVIFGAGNVGRMALRNYKGNVVYFVDNNTKLHGSTIENIPIKGIESYIDDAKKYKLIIASYSQRMIEKQVKELGISEYELYLNEHHGYYVMDDIIFNLYEDNCLKDVTEREYINNSRNSYLIQAVNQEVEDIYNKKLLFSHIEIETVNRCNGSCAFCPVSKGNDKRDEKQMSDELFEKIILELANINYSGRLALFSNNEPFLDEDIIGKHKYARKMLPRARMHLFTNGTLLTLNKFKEIINYLDELVIDNYQQDLQLIKPCQLIADYCEDKPELKKKVTIVLRKPNEILSSRGGDSPNRNELIKFEKDRCILPFKQMIIRPDGKVSLCCCDPLGRNTLGDVSKSSLIDVWNNDKYKMVRKCLYEGRGNWKHCEYCDYFSLG